MVHKLWNIIILPINFTLQNKRCTKCKFLLIADIVFSHDIHIVIFCICFRNKEYILILAVLFAVFMIVHFLKRINYNYSVEIAIAVGTGAYIVLSLAAELALHTLTTQRLLTFVIGGLVSGALAILINSIYRPLDYSRTESVEFEDDEYNYYVKAVPKATFEKERVQVKRINKRKIL